MQTVRRRCAQTAHISLHSHQCQRAWTQNKQHTRTSGVSAVAHPDFVTSVSSRFPSAPSASLRLVVFGEAVFRESFWGPQEKKAWSLSFFCRTQRLKGFFAGATEKLSAVSSGQAGLWRQIGANLPESAARFWPLRPNHPPDR